MMLTLVFGSKKGKKEVFPPVLMLLLDCDGTREPWGAGELVLLISPPPPWYLSQAGDEPGKVLPVPKYAAEICFQLPLPTASFFFLRTLNSLPAFCFYGPKRTFVFYLRK